MWQAYIHYKLFQWKKCVIRKDIFQCSRMAWELGWDVECVTTWSGSLKQVLLLSLVGRQTCWTCAFSPRNRPSAKPSFQSSPVSIFIQKCGGFSVSKGNELKNLPLTLSLSNLNLSNYLCIFASPLNVRLKSVNHCNFSSNWKWLFHAYVCKKQFLPKNIIFLRIHANVILWPVLSSHSSKLLGRTL